MKSYPIHQDAENLSGFLALTQYALQEERRRAEAAEIAWSSFEVFQGRIKNYLLPYFQESAPSEISLRQINAFVAELQTKNLKASSIRLILTSLRRVLYYAYLNGWSQSLPVMPRIRSDSTPRGGFTPREYLCLWHEARRQCTLHEPQAPGAEFCRELHYFSKDHPMFESMPHLIRFMVNSFVRPTDLRWIKHRHISICRGQHTYLRLELPESKRHSSQIISMPAAVGIYERLVESARTLGYDRPDDFLFLPEVENRKTAMVLLDLYFRRVLQASGLRVGKRGQNRTLYSLRHTAITFRLLFGRGIDLLTLARNARTSVEMIERFYASELSAEMNVALLHSRRNFGK
jgi:integrase